MKKQLAQTIWKNPPVGILISLLTLTYLLVSLYLYSKYGIKIMNDSPRYLTYADNLSTQGIYFDPLNFWYISYVFFVYFSQLIDHSHGIIILNQYILGYFAMLAVCFATIRLSKNNMAGFLAGMVFIFFPDNLNWHSYVLTESFYCSILAITFYILVRLSQERKPWIILTTSALLIICFFSKPTSPALFIALAFPFVWKWLRKPSYRIIKFSALVIAGISFLFLANKMISSHRVMLIYENGDIIFAMHEFPTHPHHDWMTIDIPENLVKSSPDQPLLQQMGRFVVSNPVYFSKLFFGKMVMFVTHIRTYWSWPHNISMILILWPLYFFSIRAMRKKCVHSYLATAGGVYFIMHTLVVSCTWADWDGRFFVPLIPLVVVLGTIGFSEKIKGLAKSDSSLA